MFVHTQPLSVWRLHWILNIPGTITRIEEAMHGVLFIILDISTCQHFHPFGENLFDTIVAGFPTGVVSFREMLYDSDKGKWGTTYTLHQPGL